MLKQDSQQHTQQSNMHMTNYAQYDSNAPASELLHYKKSLHVNTHWLNKKKTWPFTKTDKARS